MTEAEERIAALSAELEAAHMALEAHPEPVQPHGEDRDAVRRAGELEAAVEAERAGHRAALDQAARAERELADAHARLHDLDARLARGPTPRRAAGDEAQRAAGRTPRALEARRGAPPAGEGGTAGLRSDRRPAVRTPVAVGALVIVVVAAGLLLVALLLKLAIAP